jgi:hypothetical protein
MRMRPTIPEGPYPQPRLCPHVGMTPSKTRMRIMIRIVLKDMAFPRFVEMHLYALITLPLNHNPRDYNKRDNTIDAANQAPTAAVSAIKAAYFPATSRSPRAVTRLALQVEAPA